MESIRHCLFFSIDDPKQNATSLLTPVSNSFFFALSSGTLGFALHGRFDNHLQERILIGCLRISTNQKMVYRATMESKTKGTT